MLDPNALADRKNNGIFEEDAQAYADYAKWRSWFVLQLRAIIKNGQYRSSIDDAAVGKLIDRTQSGDAAVPRERVFNAVIADMIERGASWEHIAALQVTAGFETNPFPQHAGKFYLLIADWIVWYEKQIEGVAN